MNIAIKAQITDFICINYLFSMFLHCVEVHERKEKQLR